MRWPWKSKPDEHRQGGGYTDAIVAALEAVASAKVADVSSTAAIEAAAGILSRAFMGCEVSGPSWVQEAVTPEWLAQVGRSLVREGASLSVVSMTGDGAVHLVPASFWNFENVAGGAMEGELESNWRARVTTYGPSSSWTRILPRSRMVFVRWGVTPGARHRGRGPTSWAATTARLQGEAERSLADELAGPIAQLIALPRVGDGAGGTERETMLASMLAKARGRLALLETTASGYDAGRVGAPQRDWKPERLGPMPPEEVVDVAHAAFGRMLAACGASPALFDAEAGTTMREALRQWHLGTVQPLARLLEHELTARLEVPVRLHFDRYPQDLAGRAQAFQKLVAGGVPANEALVTAGLLADAE